MYAFLKGTLVLCKHTKTKSKFQLSFFWGGGVKGHNISHQFEAFILIVKGVTRINQ